MKYPVFKTLSEKVSFFVNELIKNKFLINDCLSSKNFDYNLYQSLIDKEKQLIEDSKTN